MRARITDRGNYLIVASKVKWQTTDMQSPVSLYVPSLIAFFSIMQLVRNCRISKRTNTSATGAKIWNDNVMRARRESYLDWQVVWRQVEEAQGYCVVHCIGSLEMQNPLPAVLPASFSLAWRSTELLTRFFPRTFPWLEGEAGISTSERQRKALACKCLFYQSIRSMQKLI